MSAFGIHVTKTGHGPRPEKTSRVERRTADGHKQTTMVYTYVLNRGRRGVQRPLDGPREAVSSDNPYCRAGLHCSGPY
jgi:hypothetical protein